MIGEVNETSGDDEASSLGPIETCDAPRSHEVLHLVHLQH